MNLPPLLTDAGHVSMSGITGSGKNAGGKTATSNWWASMLVDRGHFDYMVSFDIKGRQYKGVSVASPSDAADAIRENETKLNWCAQDADNLGAEHTEAYRFATGLPGSVVFVHDDAVNYADSPGLKEACSMGGNPGPGSYAIKSIVVSQDMWDLPRKAVRTNLNNVGWVGHPTAEMRRYFEVMKKDQVADTVEDRHTKPYMWSINDGIDTHTFGPVPEKYST